MQNRLFGLLAAIILLLSACGGGGREGAPAAASAPQPQTLDVVMQDIYYGESGPSNVQDPPVWTLRSGATVTVNVQNKGNLQHNWAIVKPGTDVPSPYVGGTEDEILLFNTGVLEAGASETATFSAPAAGEYLVICTVAGHYPSMQGKLVVN